MGTTGGRGVQERLLSLKRDYGNAAVATMVQRRERPQSTDAPGHRAKKVVQAPAPEDFAPTGPNPKYAGRDDADLGDHIEDWTKSNVPNMLYEAVEMSEELWWRHHDRASRAYALGVYRLYKQLGDAKRTAFWLGVFQGTITPGAPESQAGKEF